MADAQGWPWSPPNFFNFFFHTTSLVILHVGLIGSYFLFNAVPPTHFIMSLLVGHI